MPGDDLRLDLWCTCPVCGAAPHVRCEHLPAEERPAVELTGPGDAPAIAPVLPAVEPPKKRGRPPLPAGEERLATTGVRFTASELKDLQARAEMLGISVSALVRNYVTGAPLPDRGSGKKVPLHDFRWVIRDAVDSLMDIPVRTAEGRAEMQRVIDKLLNI